MIIIADKWIHLIINIGPIQGYIYRVGGTIMMRFEKRLFIRSVTYDEVHDGARRLHGRFIKLFQQSKRWKMKVKKKKRQINNKIHHPSRIF